MFVQKLQCLLCRPSQVKRVLWGPRDWPIHSPLFIFCNRLQNMGGTSRGLTKSSSPSQLRGKRNSDRWTLATRRSVLFRQTTWLPRRNVTSCMVNASKIHCHVNHSFSSNICRDLAFVSEYAWISLARSCSHLSSFPTSMLEKTASWWLLILFCFLCYAENCRTRKWKYSGSWIWFRESTATSRGDSTPSSQKCVPYPSPHHVC